MSWALSNGFVQGLALRKQRVLGEDRRRRIPRKFNKLSLKIISKGFLWIKLSANEPSSKVVRRELKAIIKGEGPSERNKGNSIS
jgi:hypothetical protein